MPSVPEPSDTILKGKWQWKSNLIPWSETEEPQWESYSPEHNYLLEKAYYDKTIEVDIGEYIVSIKHMIQTKKGNIIAQRPIRRITCEDDEPDVRSERYFETELPKTINKIFGSLDHFIAFFSRRNPEIMGFTKQFEEFEQSNDLNGLNKDILPKLMKCLEEELLKPIEDQLKDPSITKVQKKAKLKSKERHEELISLLMKEFASFEEFYGVILKSYTMNTSLYLNLNKYLRNESWTHLDNLLPYAICLCKAFFTFKFSKDSEKESGLKIAESSIILYRGTALDEFALSNYQTGEASVLFSWNSVTSTSRNKKMAEQFMYKSVDMEKKKYPVLFIIEIPLTEGTFDSEYLKWIDIHKYSAMPDEDEVILAPGSAFELVKFFTDQEKRTTIQVKLKPEVESLAHGGLIMHGAFQNEMMSDRQVKIMCLEGEELYEALRNISGNRLIEEIEFCLCIFDRRSLEEMLSTLPTLEKARGLKLISCKYGDKQEISSARLPSTIACKIEEIEIYEVQYIFKIMSLNKQDDNFWRYLRTVNIDFRNIVFDNCELPTFKFPTELTSMNLDFATCKLEDKVVKNLTSQGLKHLTQLTSLTLDFRECYKVTDKGVSNLASQALRYLTQLTSLTLDFRGCHQITDKGMSNLASQALRYLTQLTSLTLDFGGCLQITDKEVNNLASQALRYLTQLTSLTLDFGDCLRISDKGVSNLESQALKYLTQLTSLTLGFGECQISDEGMSNLASQAPKYLTQLASFIFNEGVVKQTRQHHQIREDQVRTNNWLRLNSTRPKSQNQLRFLVDDLPSSTRSFENSNFERLVLISKEDEEIKGALNKFLLELMYCQYVKMPPDSALVALSLCKVVSIERSLDEKTTDLLIYSDSLSGETDHLFEREQIKDKEVSNSASQSLHYLTQLTSLTLDFRGCHKITDKGVSNLASQALKHLTQLTSLTLDFCECHKITDEGMSNLASQALRYLTQLTSLTLDFDGCYKISDEGVSNLASQALRYIAQLTSLTLDFGKCSKISDEGVNNLIYQMIRHSLQLTTLNLDFSSCKVTEFTAQGMAKMLHYFGFIESQK